MHQHDAVRKMEKMKTTLCKELLVRLQEPNAAVLRFKGEQPSQGTITLHYASY